MFNGKFTTPLAVLLAAVIIAFSGYAGLTLAVEGGEPGSSDDPLVTKSFVENYVAEHLQSTGSAQWQIKTMEPGDEFNGTAGTDFVLRTGNALVVDPTGTGIPDLTDGANGFHGAPVQKNHLYSLPRTDGRGVLAVDKTVLMFRGAEAE